MTLSNPLPRLTSETESLSINRILCPFDFSGPSMTALRYASSLARHFGSKLLIRHVADIPASLLLAGAEPGAITGWRQQLPQLKHDIEAFVEEAGIQGNETEVMVCEGPILDLLVRMISQERIDLTVMGTHGHKGFNRLVLGSVTEGVIHHVSCPVLVVGKPELGFVQPEQPASVKLQTILFATDFSPRSDRALAYALKWACEWAAKLIVLHTVPELPPGTAGMLGVLPEYNPYFDRQLSMAWEQMRDVVPHSIAARCEVSYEVRHGDPRHEIISVAEQRKADLIVLGARGAGGAASLWGSVSSAVVRSGRFPSMVVREA
jgi:nucleotide-binding universal stress UspA family protein